MKFTPIFVASVAVLTMSGCMRQIPPSSVGVKFNGVTGFSQKLLKPELTTVWPNEQLIIYPTSIKNASYVRAANEGERQGGDSVRASTIEGAILPVDVTVAFHVDPENVLLAFQNFGTEDLEGIQRVFIRSAADYAVNTVAGTRSIFDLTAKERAKFGPEVKAVLGPLLSKYGITVDDVYIGEVYPSKEIQAKVSESIAVRTQLDTSRNELERAKIDAKTIETQAKQQAEISALLALQGDVTIALKKQEIRRKAIAKWKEAGGATPMVGDGTIPFTQIKLR